MKPVLINKEIWTISLLPSFDARLIDRTGLYRLATTDPGTRSIYLSLSTPPDMIDQVLLHEVAHAITISYGLLPFLHDFIPRNLWFFVEEWSANIIEQYSIEAISIASQALGRPLCLGSLCTITF